MRILGVDPGLHITGYGCITVDTSIPDPHRSNITLAEAGVVRTRPKDSLDKRLAVLFHDFTEVLKDFMPEIMVIEDLYSHYKNPRTAIIMGHARGTIITAASSRDVDVVAYSANRIKNSLTGNGHASKEQMQRMIMTMLGLDSPPSPADVADALGVALCHANVILHQHNN
ncbi:crossover junction endodeoxyribonuclease RuvC [candidate division KSB1 bacterium]